MKETKTVPNRYRIMNRVTKEWWEGEAPSAQEACQFAGWLIGDCWVRQYSPRGAWLEWMVLPIEDRPECKVSSAHRETH